MVYCNVNRHSDNVDHFMHELKPKFFCTGETHVRGTTMHEAARRVEKNGWTATWSPSQKSKESLSGTYGGAMCAATKGVASKPLSGDETSGATATTSLCNLAGRILTLDHGEIYIFAGCARQSDVNEGLRQVANATGFGKHPFVLLCDSIRTRVK